MSDLNSDISSDKPNKKKEVSPELKKKYLWQIKRLSGSNVTLADIAKALGIQKQSANEVLQILLAENYIDKRRDKNKIYFSLSEKGYEELKETQAFHDNFLFAHHNKLHMPAEDCEKAFDELIQGKFPYSFFVSLANCRERNFSASSAKGKERNPFFEDGIYNLPFDIVRVSPEQCSRFSQKKEQPDNMRDDVPIDETSDPSCDIKQENSQDADPHTELPPLKSMGNKGFDIDARLIVEGTNARIVLHAKEKVNHTSEEGSKLTGKLKELQIYDRNQYWHRISTGTDDNYIIPLESLSVPYDFALKLDVGFLKIKATATNKNMPVEAVADVRFYFDRMCKL